MHGLDRFTIKVDYFYENNGALPRFKRETAQNLIKYYPNIDLSERLIRYNLNDENRDHIINLLVEAEDIATTNLNNDIDSELSEIKGKIFRKKILFFVGASLIAIGIFFFIFGNSLSSLINP